MNKTDSTSKHPAPDCSCTALLLIDVINDLDFPGSEQLLQFAEPMALQLAALAERARQAAMPVVYVNDNFGRWRSDFKAQIEHCSQPACKGAPIARLLRPHDDDYFVLKPKHSGFFSTSLDILLRYFGTEHVILAGIAGNNCVLFTANDAYMRDLKLIVPKDGVASNTIEENEYALEQMKTVLKADVTTCEELSCQRLEQLVTRSNLQHKRT